MSNEYRDPDLGRSQGGWPEAGRLDDLLDPDPAREGERANKSRRSAARSERRFLQVQIVTGPLMVLAAVGLSVSYLFFTTNNVDKPGLPNFWSGVIWAVIAVWWTFTTIRAWRKLRRLRRHNTTT